MVRLDRPHPTADSGSESPLAIERPSPPWVSKLVVAAMFLFLGVFAFGAFWKSRQADPEATTHVSPFKPTDGEWEGESATWRDGALVERRRERFSARHVLAKDRRYYVRSESEGEERGRFRTVGYFEQEVRHESEAAREDGSFGPPVIEKHLNMCDFELALVKRRVIRANGHEMIEFAGRIADDAAIWTRDAGGVREEFRERVEGDTLEIRGMTVSGDEAATETLLHAARYRRVGSSAELPAERPPTPEEFSPGP